MMSVTGVQLQLRVPLRVHVMTAAKEAEVVGEQVGHQIDTAATGTVPPRRRTTAMGG
jgi:hypothetical protein